MESHYVRIAQLINLHLEGTISPEEMEELLSWQEKYPQISRWIDQKELRRTEVQDLYDQYDGSTLLASDWQKIISRRDALNKKRQRTSWLIAASVVSLFFVGIWFFQGVNKSEALDTGISDESAMVQPGKEQAYLTLSGGETVLLDSRDEQVVREGGAEINFVGNQLDYTAITDKKAYWHKLNVPTGGTYFVRLNDGTKVWLNAETELEYPSVFTGKERQVVVQGEAYFEIAENSQQPFIVRVNGTAVKALGTAFNINTHAHKGTVKTILTEGKIEVSVGDKTQIVTPGYAALSDGKGLSVEKADLEEALALKEGNFYFNGKRLHEILGEISRWYGVELRLKKNLNQETYKGGIKRDASIESVRRVLEDLTGYRITVDNRVLSVE